MKIRLSILSVLLYITLAFPQNAKITTGVIQVDSGDYERAIETLETALKNPEPLKESNIPKGYYYLSTAYQKLASDTSYHEKYPDAAMKSYEAYLNAKAHETYADKNLKRKIDNQASFLVNILYNKGAIVFNDSRGYNDFNTSSSYFKAVTELDADNYNAFTFLGYSKLNIKDTIASIEALDKSISIFKKLQTNGEMPTSLIGNAYIIDAQLNYLMGNNARAIQLVEDGKLIFSGASEDKKQIYQNLDRIGLTIYSNDPGLFQKAIENYDKSIESEPNNTILKLSYAGLLAKRPEVEYQNKSFELFNDVLKTDPDNLNANFNLGAYYVNKAADISKRIADTFDDAEYLKLEERMKENLFNAYPYMNKLHQLEPNNVMWINQLISIVSYMPDKDEELMRLMKLRRELQRQ